MESSGDKLPASNVDNQISTINQETDSNPSTKDPTRHVMEHESEKVSVSLPANGICETSDASMIRSTFGLVVTKASGLINDNLILARYGIFASISILAVYGISQTPLFFRYRTVFDIPASHFIKRKSIYCRIIKLGDELVEEKPITLYVRHLSPMERILPNSIFNWFMKFHPSRTFDFVEKPEESCGEMLRLQIAGVQIPPSSSLINTRTSFDKNWLSKLAAERHQVRCKLLARKVYKLENIDTDINVGITSNNTRKKRPIPGLVGDSSKEYSSANGLLISSKSQNIDQTAIAMIYFRSKTFQLFPSDLGELLIRDGRAFVASDYGLYLNSNDENVVDTSTSINHLKKDVNYFERLGRAEYEACRGSHGVWADDIVRAKRKDVVSEVEFQEKAPTWKKVWRWFSGG